MNYLQKKRKSLGLTQSDVEKITGIDSATISLYENNMRIPTVYNAKMLGKLYGFDWKIIFENNSEDSDDDNTGTRRKA